MTDVPALPSPALARRDLAAGLLQLTASEVEGLVRRYPVLLRSASATVAAKIESHCAILDVTPAEFGRMVLVRPVILGYTVENLLERVHVLAEFVPNTLRLHKAIRANPHLLMIPVERLRSRVVGVAEVLGLSVVDYGRKIATQPALLQFGPERARAHGEMLASVLGLPSPMAARPLLARNPMLLSELPASVAARFGAFALDVPPAALVRMVTRSPHLLSRSPATLKSHRDGVSDVLGLLEGEMQEVVRRYPAVLLMRPAMVAMKIEQLTHRLSVSPEVVVALAVKQPQVLSAVPERVAEKVEAIAQIAEELGVPLDAACILRRYYGSINNSLAYFETRLLLARQGLGPRWMSGLLGLSNAKAPAARQSR